jgi:hypothetical protein
MMWIVAQMQDENAFNGNERSEVGLEEKNRLKPEGIPQKTN